VGYLDITDVKVMDSMKEGALIWLLSCTSLKFWSITNLLMAHLNLVTRFAAVIACGVGMKDVQLVLLNNAGILAGVGWAFG
jgi:hypothetical protein